MVLDMNKRSNPILRHLPFIIFVIIVIFHIGLCISYRFWDLLPLAVFPIMIIFVYGIRVEQKRG